jgi:hypothetical protein
MYAFVLLDLRWVQVRQHLAGFGRVEAVGVSTCPRLPCEQLARRHKFRTSRYRRLQPRDERPNVLCLTEHLAAAFELLDTLRLGIGDPILLRATLRA